MLRNRLILIIILLLGAFSLTEAFTLLDKINAKSKASLVYNKKPKKVKRPLDLTVTPPLHAVNDGSWADSIYNALSVDERIAQLFMVTAFSNKDQKHVDEISNLISNYKIGGIMFLQGGPLRQANLTNMYQKLSRVPLFVAIDAEWGLAMRLDSTPRFPKQMALGAIQNDSLIYTMGKEIAYQCKRMGIHINFAPVVDVNNNPDNPVIGIRSFGENKKNVARKGVMYMKGLQDNGIIANAKHFPGHGDTDVDSHKSLPVINHTRARIDSMELYPFTKLMENGLMSVMVAHLYIPSLDSAKNTATTLSKNVVTHILKDSLKFKGLVFTDALNMKGVSAYFKPGEVDVRALIAGNDILLCAEDVPVAIEKIRAAVDSGLIKMEEIEMRCRKILKAKEWAGLDNYKPIDTANLYLDLNNPMVELANIRLTEASLTVLKNNNNLLPLKRLDTLKIASLALNSSKIDDFQKMLDNYGNITHYNIGANASSKLIDSVYKKISSEHNLVIVAMEGATRDIRNYGFTPDYMNLVDSLAKKTKVILNVLASPYSISKYDGVKNLEGLVISFEDTYYTQMLTPQLIFGGIAANGKLPVAISKDFKAGAGIRTALPTRLKFTIPEELGVGRNELFKVDFIANEAIQKHATPGCEIFIAKDGKAFYNKAYGHHTYESKVAVKADDLYDLASITKIAASVPAVMKMVDEDKVKLSDQLCTHLPEVECTNKHELTIKEILSHQAGLKAWIPFWVTTMNRGDYNKGVYSNAQDSVFALRVAENLFIDRGYTDSIMSTIIRSNVSTKRAYLYSDLGYYFIKKIIEDKTKTSFDKYLDSTFYKPLGLRTMTYLPRRKFSIDRIPPTEYDMQFRKQLIQGDVHDQGAAMMGGIAGHAGLFSNAKDLGVLMQMYLNKGVYGGERYVSEASITEFTKCQYCNVGNRRALGFDKPEPDASKDSPVCRCVSASSYGHSGFTGTFTWVDPENKLVYVFLSNRVYPDADNKKLVNLNTRSRIHQEICNLFLQ